MNFLQLSSQLTESETSAFKGKRLSERHYVLVLSDAVEIRDVEGALVAVLLKNVIPQSVQTEVLPYLATLRGNLSNRASVVGEGAQMPQLRADGTVGLRRGVPSKVLKVHGGKGDILGFFDFDYARSCRETSWTNKNPEAMIGMSGLIAYVDHFYKRCCPVHYARQMNKVDDIDPSLKIGGTAFTTVTVNYNNRTRAHTDKGDVRDGLGCLTTHGQFTGSYFIMPKYQIAFDVQPGDLLLANVHELHGNGAMAPDGRRYSCVFYARERMHLCGTRKVD